MEIKENKKKIPIVSFVGISKSGKTTTLEQLLPVLKQRGHRVSVIKHASHKIIFDHEGTDSFRFQKAGAYSVGLSGTEGFFLMKPDAPFVGLEDIVSKHFQDSDLVITEGFKKEKFPKIETISLYNPDKIYCIDNKELNKDLIALIGKARPTFVDHDLMKHVEFFRPNEIEALASFIEEKFL